MKMGHLAKLVTFYDKYFADFFLYLLRLIILTIFNLRKNYRHLNSNYKYRCMINKKSSRFVYRTRSRTGNKHPNVVLVEYCTICLSEFEEGEEGIDLIDCKHSFHSRCLDKWLLGYRQTCPLCRSLVVPPAIVAEYHHMQITEQENVMELRNWLGFS